MKKIVFYSIYLLMSNYALSQTERQITIHNKEGKPGRVVTLVPCVAKHAGKPGEHPYIDYQAREFGPQEEHVEVKIPGRAARIDYPDGGYKRQDYQWTNRFFVEYDEPSRTESQSVSSPVALDTLENPRGSNAVQCFDCVVYPRKRSQKVLIRHGETYEAKAKPESVEVKSLTQKREEQKLKK